MFREDISVLERLLGNHSEGLVALAKSLPMPVRIALPMVGGLIAGLLIARRGASKQANADYMEAVIIGDGVVPVWQSVWRSMSSLVTIASGGSIGREGSMVQLAALVSSLIGRWVHFDPPRLRLLVACGAAAGITSAYNAPIAGAFFVTELVLGSMAMESFGPIVVSSGVGNITMREFAGYKPPYEMPVSRPSRASKCCCSSCSACCQARSRHIFCGCCRHRRSASPRCRYLCSSRWAG